MKQPMLRKLGLTNCFKDPGRVQSPGRLVDKNMFLIDVKELVRIRRPGSVDSIVCIPCLLMFMLDFVNVGAGSMLEQGFVYALLGSM